MKRETGYMPDIPIAKYQPHDSLLSFQSYFCLAIQMFQYIDDIVQVCAVMS